MQRFRFRLVPAIRRFLFFVVFFFFEERGKTEPPDRMLLRVWRRLMTVMNLFITEVELEFYQSYSAPIVMLNSPVGTIFVEWYHWLVSRTTEK